MRPDCKWAGSIYEGRLRGLSEAVQAAFVDRAEGFSPPASVREWRCKILSERKKGTYVLKFHGFVMR